MPEVTQASGKREPVSAVEKAVTGLHLQSQLGSPHTTECDTEVSDTNKTKPAIMKQRQKDHNEQAFPQSPLLIANQMRHLAQFIGAKALARCNLKGLTVDALLDTGAQVSRINRGWKERYLPDAPVRPLSEICDKEELEGHTVNGDFLPFDG